MSDFVTRVGGAAAYEDVLLNQWLALTPELLLKSHLGLDQATIDLFNKSKKPIVRPS
jgi:oxalate decarboxylase/phosphoglucose isomerase-like protein (cupin superfamily)